MFLKAAKKNSWPWSSCSVVTSGQREHLTSLPQLRACTSPTWDRSGRQYMTLSRQTVQPDQGVRRDASKAGGRKVP